MPTLLRWMTSISVVTLLIGCSASIPIDPASPYYKVAPGSTLKVNQRIEIPPGVTRVFMQNGAIVRNFDQYAPNCNVEVYRLEQERAQYIEPGEYRIHRVQNTVEEVVQKQRLQVAALGTGPWLMMASGGADRPDVHKGYHLWVEDPAGNFTRLSCRGAFDTPWDARPPSINQMRRALGDIADLVLAN